jgi:hypothetical protein
MTEEKKQENLEKKDKLKAEFPKTVTAEAEEKVLEF